MNFPVATSGSSDLERLNIDKQLGGGIIPTVCVVKGGNDMPTRYCKWCGKAFEHSSSRGVPSTEYCSVRCYTKAKENKAKEEAARKKKIEDAGGYFQYFLKNLKYCAIFVAVCIVLVAFAENSENQKRVKSKSAKEISLSVNEIMA